MTARRRGLSAWLYATVVKARLARSHAAGTHHTEPDPTTGAEVCRTCDYLKQVIDL